MLSRIFVNLVVSSTSDAIRETGYADGIESSYIALGGDYCGLEDPTKFDHYSWLFFKSISRYISGGEQRDRITAIIGRKIYSHIKHEYALVAGGSDDLDKMRSNLEQVIRFFVDSGYVDSAQVVWNRFNDEVWEERGRSQVELVMTKPVILPSAQRLYNEEGFAQHYLSRTIEAALEDFSVAGRETKNFNPNQSSSDRVVELWELTRL